MKGCGKTAIVTGAAGGIGLAIAEKLAQDGIGVALCDLNYDMANHQAEMLKAKGYCALPVQVDVSDVEQIKSMVEATVKHFGGLDILVNNAGILNSSSIMDMAEQVWDKVMAVNLKGVFFACQAALEHLKKSKAGRIINVSSLAGRMGGYETGLAYTASKGGVLSLTMGMARQLAPFGITVNSLCPGTTDSDIIKQWSEQKIEGLKSRIPLGRLGKVEDMAAAASFLASDSSSYITGHCLDVNGGLFMS